MKSLILIITLLISFSFASKEGVLPLSSFSIKSNGIGESGPVEVIGERSEENVITAFSVIAFGDTIIIPSDSLQNLGDVFYNGIQISYERGYQELGGRTVYISFLFGFISGNREKRIIAVSEDGSFRFLSED